VFIKKGEDEGGDERMSVFKFGYDKSQQEIILNRVESLLFKLIIFLFVFVFIK